MKQVHLLTLLCVLILGFVFTVGCTDTPEKKNNASETESTSDDDETFDMAAWDNFP